MLQETMVLEIGVLCVRAGGIASPQFIVDVRGVLGDCMRLHAAILEAPHNAAIEARETSKRLRRQGFGTKSHTKEWLGDDGDA